MTRSTVGELEEQILLVLLHLGGRAYAVQIVKEFEARTGRSISAPTSYMVLRRLEARGFLTSELGDPVAERGGRARRFFEINSESAMPILRASRAARLALWQGLDHVMEESS